MVGERSRKKLAGALTFRHAGGKGGTDTQMHSRTKVTTSICIAADSFTDFLLINRYLGMNLYTERRDDTVSLGLKDFRIPGKENTSS